MRLGLPRRPVTLFGGGIAQAARVIAVDPSVIAVIANAIPHLARPITQSKLVVSQFSRPIPLACESVSLVGDIIPSGTRGVPFVGDIVPLVGDIISGLSRITHRSAGLKPRVGSHGGRRRACTVPRPCGGHTCREQQQPTAGNLWQ